MYNQWITGMIGKKTQEPETVQSTSFKQRVVGSKPTRLINFPKLNHLPKGIYSTRKDRLEMSSTLIGGSKVYNADTIDSCYAMPDGSGPQRNNGQSQRICSYDYEC